MKLPRPTLISACASAAAHAAVFAAAAGVWQAGQQPAVLPAQPFSVALVSSGPARTHAAPVSTVQPDPAAPSPLPALGPRIATAASKATVATPRPSSPQPAPLALADTGTVTPPSAEPASHAPQATSPRPPAEHPAGTVTDTGTASSGQPVQGGPVSAARYDLASLNNPAPAYPASSRRLGEEGRVLLRVRVNRDGQAENVEIDTSSGFARLDQAAVTAVRQWRFAPARQGDVPVAAWARVPIRFRLDEAG